MLTFVTHDCISTNYMIFDVLCLIRQFNFFIKFSIVKCNVNNIRNRCNTNAVFVQCSFTDFIKANFARPRILTFRPRISVSICSLSGRRQLIKYCNSICSSKILTVTLVGKTSIVSKVSLFVIVKDNLLIIRINLFNLIIYSFDTNVFNIILNKAWNIAFVKLKCRTRSVCVEYNCISVFNKNSLTVYYFKWFTIARK